MTTLIKERHRIDGEYEYKNMVLMGKYTPRTVVDQVPSFSLNGDIVVASYPKTGTTWVQEIVWLISNNVDVATARSVPLPKRSWFLELFDVLTNKTYMDQLKNVPHPRAIKTHLPADFFHMQLDHEQVKFVVPVRNPKDTLVSLYHFYRSNVMLGNYTGSWNEFYDELVSDNHLSYGDYFDWYVSWVEAKPQTKILFVKYEDLKKNLSSEVKKIATFLGKDLSVERVDQIAGHCSFDCMKVNPSTNLSHVPKAIINQDISPFMRKGEVGDWKNYFTTEQSEAIDRRYAESLELKGLQLEFGQ